jgi:hypothetical protein
MCEADPAEPWLLDTFWINPKRPRKIVKHISRGTGEIAKINVAVEFPLTERYALVRDVRIVHAGYIRYRDFGTSEAMAEHGLTYKATEAGTKKADLFVLVFDFLGNTYVRRMFRGRKNVGPWRARLLQNAANKVALSISKDERNLMKKFVRGYKWPSIRSYS